MNSVIAAKSGIINLRLLKLTSACTTFPSRDWLQVQSTSEYLNEA
jgi:hypothetical protein